MTSRISDIAELHRSLQSPSEFHYCAWCKQGWPCDAYVALQLAAEAVQALVAVEDALLHGGIHYDAEMAGYEIKSGPDEGQKIDGVFFGAGLVVALEEAHKICATDDAQALLGMEVRDE